MCTENTPGEVVFTLSRVITLGIPESFVLRRAPTRHIIAEIVETTAPTDDFIAARCSPVGLFGPAPSVPRGLIEEVLLPKGVGVFVQCEYLGNVPEGRRYGQKFTFSVTFTGRAP